MHISKDVSVCVDYNKQCFYIDFYLYISSINNTILHFQDKDVRLDFRDHTIKLELIFTLTETTQE
jgi:hypothetical protein